MIQKATTTGNWWLAASSWQCACSCIMSHAEFFITQVTQPRYSPDLVPCDSWLFPKLKSPLKGKRFQTDSEIQENMMGQLMVIERTMWGPTVPTMKGTEVSLSYVQCFLYLLSSSINVSIFHVTWMDTFGTDLIIHKICKEWGMKKRVLWKQTCWVLEGLQVFSLILLPLYRNYYHLDFTGVEGGGYWRSKQ